MKKLCDVVIAVVMTVAIGAAFYFGNQYAENQEAKFRQERDAHVLATWDGEHDNPGHTCEYGPDWCNPNYAAYLRNKKH